MKAAGPTHGKGPIWQASARSAANREKEEKPGVIEKRAEGAREGKSNLLGNNDKTSCSRLIEKTRMSPGGGEF